MLSRLRQVIPLLASISVLGVSCAKSHDKFNLSSPHQDRSLIITMSKDAKWDDVQSELSGYSITAEQLNEESVLIRFASDTDLLQVATEIASAPHVKAVEANVIYQLYEKLPNDTDFSKLYGMRNTGQDSGIAGADIGAAAAWDQTTGSKSVLVGIIDSGMDYTHPDLATNVWTNPGETGLDANGNDKRSNGIDDDGDGFIDDWHGWDFANNDNDPMDDNSHGTHVAGTIGGVGNNGSGITGVNWVVSMVPIKVFSASGSTTTDTLVKGIDYATKLGVFVTNNSWGGGAFSDAIFAAIQKANDKGILFISAAGNESENNDSGDHYPSNYDVPNIISVAAINRRDEVSSFSNYGGATVDVAAPGEDIYSAAPGGTYAVKSGTSMATPHVTGAVALLRARYPNLTSLQIKDKLLGSAVMTPALASKVIHGRINLANAMEQDTIPPTIVSGIKIIETGIDKFKISWNLSGDDGDVGEATSYTARISPSPIVSEADWSAAETVSLVDLSRNGKIFSASVLNIAYNRSANIVIRATDNVGNLSGISESIPFTLKSTEVLWSEENEAVNQWDQFGTPWGVTTVDGFSVISDSPGGALYANGIDKSAVSKEIKIGKSDLSLELRMKYQLEKSYDFGYIELSIDGGLTWKEVGSITGNSDWITTSYGLKDAIGTATSFKLRLRLKSDQSVNYDGWDVDSLKIVGQRG